MGSKITLEILQRELEGLGRLEVAVKAEVGALRDQVSELTRKVEEANKRADRMADKLMEMAMISMGNAREAVSLRRVSEPVVNDTDWGTAEDEVWPPKGFVEVNVP